MLVGNQNLTGLAAIVPAHNSGVLQLVHQTTRPVITDLQFALYHARTAHLVQHHHTRCILKHRIPIAGIQTITAQYTSLFLYLWQNISSWKRPLLSDEINNPLHFWGIYKRTL